MVVVIDRVLELPGPRAAAKHWPPALRLDGFVAGGLFRRSRSGRNGWLTGGSRLIRLGRRQVDHQPIAGVEGHLPVADDFLAVFRPLSFDVVAVPLAGLQGRRNELAKRAGLSSLLAFDPDLGVRRHTDADQHRVVGDRGLGRRGRRSRRRVDLAKRSRAVRRSAIAIIGSEVIAIVGGVGVGIVKGVIVWVGVVVRVVIRVVTAPAPVRRIATKEEAIVPEAVVVKMAAVKAMVVKPTMVKAVVVKIVAGKAAGIEASSIKTSAGITATNMCAASPVASSAT